MMSKTVREVLDIVWAKGVAYGIESSNKNASDVAIDQALREIAEIVRANKLSKLGEGSYQRNSTRQIYNKVYDHIADKIERGE